MPVEHHHSARWIGDDLHHFGLGPQIDRVVGLCVIPTDFGVNRVIAWFGDPQLVFVPAIGLRIDVEWNTLVVTTAIGQRAGADLFIIQQNLCTGWRGGDRQILPHRFERESVARVGVGPRYGALGGLKAGALGRDFVAGPLVG